MIDGVKPIATNRRALRDYSITERFEAGIELAGTEVKSLRAGTVSLEEGYAAVEGGQVFLVNVNIAPYAQGNIHNRDPRRRRRLLLHRDEIKRLFGKTTLRGFTLIPLKVYFNDRGRAKVELGLGKGKKLEDRREELRRRAMEMDDRRAGGLR
ncbi:SsrA-binding protein SmpB [candidate division WOR-3 bacterium]|nr:SsrA-binding protein SmpB [candidate division WOR-3 bacterium]